MTKETERERLAARHGKWFASAAFALIMLLAVTFSPAVRAQLRESFTRLPSEYTELYFSLDPTLMGTGTAASVHVPVALVHHGTATQTFTVRGTITAMSGGPASTGETFLAGFPDEVASTVLAIRVPRRAAAYVVDVTLPGHSQSLHFRLDTKGAA